MSPTTQQKLIIVLLGLATVVAGAFTWRAGQLASAAAFSDRQAVGQTVKQEAQNIRTGLAVVNDISQYVSYVADYAEAAAADDLAEESGAAGEDSAAEAFEDEAESLRTSTAARAAAAGVLGQQDLLRDLETASVTPREFDLEAQTEQVRAEVTTGISGPGLLDPDYWADNADDLRVQVRGLRLAALLMIVGVVLYTVAQMADRPVVRLSTASGATALCVATSAVVMARVWS